MASHLVLLGSPRELHIPYFAMGVRWLRENRVERLDLGTDLTRLVGRRCAAWIKARTERDRIELMATRNYVAPQTTFCATWLLFDEQPPQSSWNFTHSIVLMAVSRRSRQTVRRSRPSSSTASCAATST